MSKQLLCILMLAISFSLSTASAQRCFDRYFKDGQQLEKSANFEQAILQYEAAFTCGNSSASEQKKALDAIVRVQENLIRISGKRRASLTGDSSPHLRTTFSRDGQFALTVSENHMVNLWKIGIDQPIARLKGHTGPVSSMVFSPDNKMIVTASAAGTARIWSSAGRLMGQLSGHSDEVSGVAFAPDGNSLLTWSRDGTAKRWSTSGNLLATMSGHRAPILAAEFSSNSDAVLTRDGDGLVMTWNKDGQVLTPRGIPHNGYVHAAKFSPNGRHVLTGGSEGTGGLWMLNGVPVTRFGAMLGAITSVDFNPDGQKMLTAGADGILRIRDAAGMVIAIGQAHRDWITKAGFSPDGKKIFTLSRDSTICLWNTDADLLHKLRHTDEVLSATFLPGSRYLVSTCRDGQARLWDLRGELMLKYQIGTDQLVSAAYSPDGEHLLFAERETVPDLAPDPPAVYAQYKEDPPARSQESENSEGIEEGAIEKVKESTSPVYESLFSVQLGVYKDPSAFDMARARKLGEVIQRERDKLTVISIAGIATRSEAERIRKKAISAGFNGAFILPSSVATETAGEQLTADAETVPVPVTVNVVEEPIARPYKIQLGAFSKPGKFRNSRIDDLGPIESRPKGDLTIKLIGGIATLEEAQQLLQLVRKRRKFERSFIVIEENGVLRKIK